MNETAFQVHYQYLLSQLWMNEALLIGSRDVGHASLKIGNYYRKAELEKQMRQLEKLYPDYYVTWRKEHELRELKSRTNVIEK